MRGCFDRKTLRFCRLAAVAVATALVAPVGVRGAAGSGESGRRTQQVRRAPAASPQTTPSGGTLVGEIERLATAAQAGKMKVGIQVVALGAQPRLVYELNAQEPLQPASNQKIFSTAAALTLLPADFKFRTVLARRGDDLAIIGSGDPAFGDPQLARGEKEPITAVFHDWVERLKAAGVDRVEGDVLFDDFIFEQQFINPSWVAQFKNQMQTRSLAPVGGLNFNDNCRETVSKSGKSIQVIANDPGMSFATMFRTVLAAKGIAVNGQVRRQRVRGADGSIPRELQVVAVHEQALDDVIRRCNKDSQNMFAEALMKSLGAYAGHPETPRVGSYATGREAIQQFLRRIGVSSEGCVFDDGSGLSHDNRATAAAFTGVLIYMSRHPREKEWLANLATPGQEGTLHRRMRDLKGRVFAKTGHIDGVATLSGYVYGPNGRRYAFSILCNNTNRGNPHNLQDAVCRKLATWTGD